MKNIILTSLLILSNLLLANAQNVTYNNVAIGLEAPDWGINIKTKFPGLTGSWNRGLFVSNETGLDHLFSIGANGNSVNGVSTFTSGFIGIDWNKPFMSFLPNGTIGIGTNAPLANVHIKSETAHLRLESAYAGYNASIQYVSGGQYRWELGTGILSGANFELYDRVNSKSSFVVNPEGNVGIGTTAPTSKLTVAGDINAREVRVTVNAGADFVFENDYNLPSLTSLDNYIKVNKHLPEIASAQAMQKDGINLSEMNIKLLQKIEEMTLYLIQQSKDMDLLKAQIKMLSENK